MSSLLENASKYTPAGGRVTLSARREDAYVVVAIVNSGTGIHPDAMGRIFEMFTQVGETPEGVRSGLGIGLSLVRRLTEMHGGTVAAASAGPGMGSTFELRLPAAHSGDEKPNESLKDSTQGEQVPLRVMVVDDNVDAADALAEFLRAVGHEVSVALDGEEALSQFPTFQPVTVFLDIGMPGMTGYEVARRLRAMPQGKRAFIAALTGWGTAADKAAASDAGFDHHLTKPADLAEVESILSSISNEKTSPRAL